MEMNWYTAYTTPNQEKKVTTILGRKNITCFCPLELKAKQENKNVNQSFNCFVFVKAAESQLSQLKKIKGIKHFLYWMNEPAVVSEAEITLIKSFLSEHSYVKLEKQDLALTSLTSGSNSQKENEAKVIHINDSKLKAALPSLKAVMVAEFEKSAIQLSSNKNIVTQLKPGLTYRIAGSN